MPNSPQEFFGFGIGFEPAEGQVHILNHLLTPAARDPKPPEQERELLLRAVAEVATETRNQANLAGPETAAILNSLALMLEDQVLLQPALEAIAARKTSERAIAAAFELQRNNFLDAPELLSRLDDLAHLINQVIAKICHCEPKVPVAPKGSVVVVAHVSASLAAELSDEVAALVSLNGSPSSHAAIILRSRGIPALLGCPQAKALQNGERVLVDPVGNRLLRKADLSSATKLMSFASVAKNPLITVLANIGSQSQAIAAAATTAKGVGLFRTELVYLDRLDAPSKEEQIQDYTRVFRSCPAGPIYARTFDTAQDKPLRFLKNQTAKGYQVLENQPELLAEQLVAIASAAANSGKEVSVMAPLLADAEQAIRFVQFAKGLISLPVGVMVETPELATEVARLKGYVDFISVGTNDLSHKLLGPSRDLVVDHWDPKVISTLAEVAKQAQLAGIKAGVCGESAADPLFAIVLAGLGFDSLSVAPSAVSGVLQAVSSLNLEQAERLSQLALGASSAEVARQRCRDELAKLGN